MIEIFCSKANKCFNRLGKKEKIEFGYNKKKALFGIIQGGLYKDLRVESLKTFRY